LVVPWLPPSSQFARKFAIGTPKPMDFQLGALEA
jgi:hypothetical protein